MPRKSKATSSRSKSSNKMTGKARGKGDLEVKEDRARKVTGGMLYHKVKSY